MSLASRWEDARINYHRGRIRHLIDREKWPQALTAVVDFAQFADGRIDDAELWLEMTIRATEIVAHLDDPAEYRAFLIHFAAPFLEERPDALAEFVEAFAVVADHAEPSVMIEVGRWLADAQPTWPLGPYLVGHFNEAKTRHDGDRTEFAQAAAQFEVVANRAHIAALKAWNLHARLRQGALLLTTGTDRRRGRQILGNLDWTQLFPREQLWMAVSLASSARWSDRLRAMDIVLDLHHAVKSGRPRYRKLKLRDLRRTAATIFKLAGLKLPDAEDRRLGELSETLFSADEARKWTSFLQTRRRLAKVAALPFDQGDQVVGLLTKLSSVYPDRWEPAAKRFQILTSGWNGDYGSTKSVPSPSRHDRRLPIVDAVARLVSLLANPTKENADNDLLSDALADLIDSLSSMGPGEDGAAARPVALVWPKLLAQQRVDLAEHEDELTRLADLHASLAPPPSYGWWPLAAHIYEAELDEAAAKIASQARVSDTPAADPRLRRYVAARTFRRAVNNRDAAEARKWLDSL